MNTPPVILLAFANEKTEGRFLHTLKDEMAALRKALQPAEDAGLCEIILLPNATTDEILGTFQRQRYRDRIAIFHYGGHADGYQLLLESSQGHNEIAHGEGLVSFLGKQDSLQLVFLNGCSTQQQSEALIQAGVPTVIGTYTAISDNLATMLAARFYSSLGQGQHMARAWEEAEDEVRLRYGGGNQRGLVFDDEEEKEEEKYDGFPWNLLVRPGSEKVKGWSLPGAVNNHLFGLPAPPARDLPEAPFHFLQRYTYEEAELFFGRGKYIRTMYTRLLDAHAAPIVLFYGQSGVGKSSLLDAGLLPRLEKEADVIYLRRDQQLGLLGTFAQAFQTIPQNTSLEPLTEEALRSLEESVQQLRTTESRLKGANKEQIEGFIQKLEEKIQSGKPQKADEIQDWDTSDFRAAWKNLEAQTDRPYIVILDQVEELFYRPNVSLPLELEDFLEVLSRIFGIPQERPKGKIILAYRKEYHPEILEACKEEGLAREEVFLQHLEKEDIEEVIRGIASTPRLKAHYRVQVEPDLPHIMAEDLLVDRDSPIAPVLQITLTKLWQLTQHEQDRYFTVAKYQELQREGLLLDSFYIQQMKQFKTAFPEQETSGLALDMLSYHTTSMGTADARSEEELKNRYEHRPEAGSLISKFKSLYLLTEAGSNLTRLAHDTLAPLVRKEFQTSERPGQRASLILENKLLAYEQDPDTLLDPSDLSLVEEGEHGMAAWKGNTLKIIESSRKYREKLQRNRRITRMGFGAFGVVLVIMGLFYYQSVLERRAEQRKFVELGTSRMLADRAEALVHIDPTEAIRVAELACDTTKEVSPEAWRTLMNIMYNKSIPSPYKASFTLDGTAVPHPMFLKKMTLSPQKNYLLLYYHSDRDKHTTLIFDLKEGKVIQRLKDVQYTAWTDAEDQLLVQKGEDKVSIWNWEKGQEQNFVTFPGEHVEAFYYHPKRQEVLIAFSKEDCRLYEKLPHDGFGTYKRAAFKFRNLRLGNPEYQGWRKFASLKLSDFQNQPQSLSDSIKTYFYSLNQDFYVSRQGAIRQISSINDPTSTSKKLRFSTFFKTKNNGALSQVLSIKNRVFFEAFSIPVFPSADTLVGRGTYMLGNPYFPPNKSTYTQEVFMSYLSQKTYGGSQYISSSVEPHFNEVYFTNEHYYTFYRNPARSAWDRQYYGQDKKRLYPFERRSVYPNQPTIIFSGGDAPHVGCFVDERTRDIYTMDLKNRIRIWNHAVDFVTASSTKITSNTDQDRVEQHPYAALTLQDRHVQDIAPLENGPWGLIFGDSTWEVRNLVDTLQVAYPPSTPERMRPEQGVFYRYPSPSILSFAMLESNRIPKIIDSDTVNYIQKYLSAWMIKSGQLRKLGQLLVSSVPEPTKIEKRILMRSPNIVNEIYIHMLTPELAVYTDKINPEIHIYDFQAGTTSSIPLIGVGRIAQIAFEEPFLMDDQTRGTISIITDEGQLIVIDGLNKSILFESDKNQYGVTQSLSCYPNLVLIDEEIVPLPLTFLDLLNDSTLPVARLSEKRKKELLNVGLD